jgi:hypothetical protein
MPCCSRNAARTQSSPSESVGSAPFPNGDCLCTTKRRSCARSTGRVWVAGRVGRPTRHEWDVGREGRVDGWVGAREVALGARCFRPPAAAQRGPFRSAQPPARSATHPDAAPGSLRALRAACLRPSAAGCCPPPRRWQPCSQRRHYAARRAPPAAARRTSPPDLSRRGGVRIGTQPLLLRKQTGNKSARCAGRTGGGSEGPHSTASAASAVAAAAPPAIGYIMVPTPQR